MLLDPLFSPFLASMAKEFLPKYKKYPHSLKKPAVKRRHRKDHPHVSTAQLLMAQVANF